MRWSLDWVIMTVAVALAVTGRADSKVLSAAYLKASIGAIDNRSSVEIKGEYLIKPGMEETGERGMLRNKGYSRFTIRDPKTGALFDSMYCKQESDVFWRLLKADKNTVFIFHGEKNRGQEREGAVFVDRIENVLLSPDDLKRRIAGSEAEDAEDQSPLRVTIVNETTGVRTVLTRVERGTPVKIEGLTITVEDEPSE